MVVEQANTQRSSRNAWIFLIVLMAVLGCILAGKQLAPKRYTVGYQHSLDYPQFQDKELIQVGSLDRG